MTTSEFIEKYNGAPTKLEELAEGAFDVVDNERLLYAAELFISAKSMLDEQLALIGVQVG
jgi:hypothetical protein